MSPNQDNQDTKYYTIVDIDNYLIEFHNQEFNWSTAIDIINSKFNDYTVDCGYYVNDFEEWKSNLSEQEFNNLQFVPVNNTSNSFRVPNVNFNVAVGETLYASITNNALSSSSAVLVITLGFSS